MLAGGSRKRGGERGGGEEGAKKAEGRVVKEGERERDKGRVFLGFEGRARATTFLPPFETNEFESFVPTPFPRSPPPSLLREKRNFYPNTGK